MPPKNKKAPDNKALKEIKKVAEDKTFGMKNKNKSKVVQKVIKGMTSAETKGGYDKFINDQFAAKKAKAQDEEERKFLESIKMGDIRAHKATEEKKDADPKTILCPYFKAG